MTGDSFLLHVLSRFGVVLRDPLLMNCSGFRAPSLPSREVDFSALVNLKQTNKTKQHNKKCMSLHIGWEGKRAILHYLSFESTLIQ